MKNRLYIILILLIWACSPDALLDCFTQSGNTEIRIYEVEAFDKITIRRNIELRITYAETQSLRVEAGENIINDINLTVIDGYLEVSAQDLCPSGIKNPAYIVHLETADLKEIRNSSQFKVKSTNTLVFDELKLTSESYVDSSALASGDFDLDLNLNQLHIIHAGLSDFQLKGNTTRMNIAFYSGSGRIFAEDLIVDKISIYHRGFADVHVFPLEEISGDLSSTGNLIIYNQPDIINIETLFEGQIIFNTE